MTLLMNKGQVTLDELRGGHSVKQRGGHSTSDREKTRPMTGEF